MKSYMIHLKYIKKARKKSYKKENYVKNLKNYKILTALFFIHFLVSYESMYAHQYDMQDQMALQNRSRNQNHSQP